jgi:hypothetical protein
MKKIVFSLSILLSGVVIAQESPEVIKTKIDDLTKQKSALESQIADLNKQLPAPVVKPWTYKGNASINVGQNLLGSDWTASYGGNSTLNLGGQTHIEANYTKGRHSWSNSFDGTLGFFKNINVDSGVNDNINKNADVLQLSTKYLFDLQKANLKVGIGANFLTQFIKTYDLAKREKLLSDFLAPGILDISPGLEWTPQPYLKIFLAPASGRFTFVTNDTIVLRNDAAANRFGNDVDQRVRTELGARLDIVFEKELVKNLSVRSRAQLFNNYTRPQIQIDAINSSRANIDVNWQTDLFYKLTKNIALNFGFQVLRDDDVRVTDKATGVKSSPWNWRNNFGIGFVAGF